MLDISIHKFLHNNISQVSDNFRSNLTLCVCPLCFEFSPFHFQYHSVLLITLYIVCQPALAILRTQLSVTLHLDNKYYIDLSCHLYAIVDTHSAVEYDKSANIAFKSHIDNVLLTLLPWKYHEHSPFVHKWISSKEMNGSSTSANGYMHGNIY